MTNESLQQRYSRNSICFGCGPANEKGLRIRSFVEGDEVIAEWQPDEAAVEETFVNSDARATLKLGQARGIALLVPAEARIIVAEYAPNQVKKTVVGAGHAEKEQIHHMVKVLLPRAQPKSPDAADALAIAICHAHHRGAQNLAKRLARS